MHESNKMSFGWRFVIYREFWKYVYFFGYCDHGCDLNRERTSVDIFLIMDMIWNVNIFCGYLTGIRIWKRCECIWKWSEWMRCHVERGYGNLTPCASTLWVRVKRHAIHHCAWTMHRGYVEGYYKSSWRDDTARGHGGLVENTLLIAERILDVTILCHNILLVFGLVVSDIRMMSLISVDQWLWYIDQFFILFWIRLESGTAYCLSWKYLHWFGIGIVYYVFDVGKVILQVMRTQL